MQIKISDIRKIVQTLCDHLEDRHMSSIEIDVDYYWNIPKDSIYMLDAEPKTFNVGQLSDDWEELQSILNGEKNPIGHDFIWLAAILRFVGEKSVW